MKKWLVLGLFASGCGSALVARPANDLGTSDWTVDYEAPDGMFCQLRHSADLYFACAEHPSFLTTATFYRVRKAAPIVAQFESIDWGLESSDAGGSPMVVGRGGDTFTVSNTPSPAVVRFEELIVEAMSALQREVREAAGSSLACDGCLNGEFCQVQYCSEPSADEFCGQNKDVCKALLPPGARCIRDAECSSGCLGIRGRCG